jgi:hypothetical protein
MLDQYRQNGHMGIQLNLAGHIKHNQVIFGDLLERIRQPVQVLEQELEAVDQTAVGAQRHLFHDIFEGDEVFDVEVGLEGEVLGGGIEVYIETGAFVVLEVLDDGGAEGRFSGAGGALRRG